ncbi:MAG: TVP38/TMEM64 family protein [Solirubrobacterales bacterium]
MVEVAERLSAEVSQLVHAAGLAAPLAFVIIYAGLTVALVPGSISSLVAGALFGVLWGTVLTVLGATLGAAVAFALARRLGRSWLRARSGSRFDSLDGWVERHGFLSVLYVRLLPVFPFSAVNYAFGVTAVDRNEYLAATALGIVPGTFALVALGSSLSDPGSEGFFAALALTLAIAVMGPAVLRMRRRRQGRQEPLKHPVDPASP